MSALPMVPQSAPMFDEEAIPPFVEAPEVAELAEKLLAKHPALGSLRAEVEDIDEPVHIAYVFDTAPFDPLKDELKHTTLGKAIKASPIWLHLAGFHAVVTIRRVFWEQFDERQRAAMLYHELLHIEVVAPGKVKLKEHSIEEFAQVMRDYGAYLPDRAHFINEWAKWESDQGGKPTNLAAKRAIKATAPDPEAGQLERATRDARRGKAPSLSERALDMAVDDINAGVLGPNVSASRPTEPVAEPDPERLSCDGFNHVPGCEHLAGRQ